MKNEIQSACDTVMILAAGKGERLQPLTNFVPKPLVHVGGKALIEYHFENLVSAGLKRIVVNHSYLGEQIVAWTEQIADKYRTIEIILSEEKPNPLETAGGIQQALPLIDRDFFLVVNADIWTDFPYTSLIRQTLNEREARLLLINTPEYKEQHDFYIASDGSLQNEDSKDAKGYTFSGISFLSAKLFERLPSGKQTLAPLLRYAINAGQAEAITYNEAWYDIGTPVRLKALRKKLNQQLIEQAGLQH